MSRVVPLVYLSLFFISGACGLIYEIVWSRLLVFVFGGTTFAVTTVLACFMGGLALGSFLSGWLADRIDRPARAYGIIEIAIGLFGAFVPVLLDLVLPLYRQIATVAAESYPWLVFARVVICGAILLIPSSLMGATLPLLTKALVRQGNPLGGAVSSLYGLNTLGAFVGCFVTGFFLLPGIGLSRSILLAAILNGGAGVAALIISSRSGESVPPGGLPRRIWTPTAQAADAVAVPTMSGPRLLFLYALSGMVAMAYQVAWTRALVLSLGASTYAFSIVVACFIFGIAAGSLLIRIVINRIRWPLSWAGVLQGVIALSALLVAPLFGEFPGLVKAMAGSKGSFHGILAMEIFCVFGLLILPTACMGAVMPLVCTNYDRMQIDGQTGDRGEASPARASRSVGTVYAANSVGTIVGICLAGFVLIPSPHIGMQRTIILASVIGGLVATAFILAGRRPSSYRQPVLIAAVWVVGLLIGVVAEPWSREVMVSGPYLGRSLSRVGEVVYYREGVDSTVAVTSFNGQLSLRINGKPDASTERHDMTTQYLLGHIPLMLKPDAQEACVIGLGSGFTTDALTTHSVKRIDVVEISDAVIEATRHFKPFFHGGLTDPRVNIHRADARNFLLLYPRTYDVITSEPSNVWLRGIANLYTREFLSIARARLKPGGLYCQWIHAYSMKFGDFAAVVRTFHESFPHLQIWEMAQNDYLIVASNQPIVLDLERAFMAFARPAVRKMLRTVFMNDPMQFAHCFIAAGPHLGPFVRDYEVLTDDLPRLEFSAPRFILRSEDMLIRGRLSEIETAPIVAGPPALTKRFIATAQRGRLARQCLVRCEVEDQMTKIFDLHLEIAGLAWDDSRMLEKILHQFKQIEGVTDKLPGDKRTQVREVLAKLVSTIEQRAPFFAYHRGITADEDVEVAWPFGSNPSSLDRDGRLAVEAATMAREEGDRDEALRLVDEVLARFSGHAPLLLTRGVWAIEDGEIEDALSFLLRSWVIDARQSSTSFHLARAYTLRGDAERALFFLQYAVDHGFDDRGAIQQSPAFGILRESEAFRRLLGQASRPSP